MPIDFLQKSIGISQCPQRDSNSCYRLEKDEIFVTSTELRSKVGTEGFHELPAGAIGLFTCYERLAQGLRQLMAGCRKFSMEFISRDDIAVLTRDAGAISGILFTMDVGREEEVEELLR